MSDLTDLTESPRIVARQNADGASISRWQNYGHDRLYVDDSKIDYVDLQTGEIHGSGKATIEDCDVDTGKLVVSWRTGWDGSWTTHELVISLTGESLDADDKAVETPPRVPQDSETAGIEQQIAAQQDSTNN